LRGHSAGVVRMCFTSAGDRLMSSSVDGSVSMWEISSDLPTTTTLTKYPTFDEYSVSIQKRTLFRKM
jgi:WD40 repeat protein